MQHIQNATKIGSAILKCHAKCNLIHGFKPEVKYTAASMMRCAEPGACKTDEWMQTCEHKDAN